MSQAGTAGNLVHPTARFDGGGFARLAAFGAFAAAMLAGLAILVHFHDRFWWAPDEGAYAHVAERILQGEVLNGSVQDIHMGYVNFANALALRIFGLDLVSLRYPLVAMTLIQSALVFWLLAGRGALAAFAGALAMSSLTVVQFLNPTAHWYALFLCLLIIALLSAGGRERATTVALLGFLVVTLFLFRQLSGVFAAMGVFTFLLLQEPRSATRRHAVLARGLAVTMLLGLGLYLAAKTDLTAGLLFGGGPLLLIVYAGVTTRLGDRCLARHILWMALGGLAALLPLLAYHLLQGSLASWWDDTVLSAFRLTELPFMTVPRYAYLGVMGLSQVLDGAGAATILNGLFWLVVPLLPAALSLSLLAALWRGRAAGRAALPVVAAFFALVSVHYQIPIYLFYSTALTLAALLLLWGEAGRVTRLAMPALCIALSAIGLHYQAGQPLSRDWYGIIEGRIAAPQVASGLARASLDLPAEDGELYRYLVNIVGAESAPEDYILALPANPELYFLAERRNPLRFFNAALGMAGEADLRATEAVLAMRPPRLVFYRPVDKYNTPMVRRLMDDLRENYDLIGERGGFEIYLLSD